MYFEIRQHTNHANIIKIGTLKELRGNSIQREHKLVEWNDNNNNKCLNLQDMTEQNWFISNDHLR